MSETSNTLIAQGKFIINASQQRVWGLLPRAIYQCLPLEKIDIVNERNFNADLRWNLIFIGLKLRLHGEFTDINPPNSFGCMLSVKKGVVQIKLKVIFELGSIDQKTTEVVCKAVEDDKGPKALLKSVMRFPGRSIAGNVFDSIRARLEEIA